MSFFFIIENKSLIISSSIEISLFLNFKRKVGSKINKYLYLLKKFIFKFSFNFSFFSISFFALIDFIKSSTFLLFSISFLISIFKSLFSFFLFLFFLFFLFLLLLLFSFCCFCF